MPLCPRGRNCHGLPNTLLLASPAEIFVNRIYGTGLGASALQGLLPQARARRRPAKRAYRARVTEKFDWVPEAGGPLAVERVRAGDGWLIRVDDGTPGESFRIVLRGRQG